MYFRLLREAEVAGCAWALNPALEIAPAIRAAVPSLWRRLLRHDQLHAGAVVEDGAGGVPTVLACGMTVFLDDRFVAEYLASPRPFLSGLVYERVLNGASPILTPDDVAVDNAAARLNLLILHFGARHPLPDDDRGRMVLAAAQAGFRLSHVGYRVRRVLADAYGAEVPFYTAGGFMLKSDFAPFYAGRPRPEPQSRPYFMGLFEEDPQSRVTGTTLSYLFHRAEPRFHFSPAEKRILFRTVIDESDSDIAAALQISRDAIKKTWGRIHERVSAVAPDLAGEPSLDGARGKERRRRLVQYLRYHLEELRPFAR